MRAQWPGWLKRLTCVPALLALGACSAPDKAALEEYAPSSPEADIEAVSLSASDNDTFDPERVGTEFPDTTKQVAVWYRWDDADSGKKVGIRWSKNGEVVLEQGDTLAKLSGSSAYILKMAAGSRLPVGDYQVELLEDGVAVTKIPFKVGAADEVEVASAAAAEAPEELDTSEPAADTSVTSDEAEPPALDQPAETAVEDPPAASVSAAANRGFPAAQDTKWPGVTMEVIEFVRKGKNLNAKLRFTNNSSDRVRPGFYYTGTYLIDQENRKYEVLKDDNGTYLGSLATNYQNWWGEHIAPGASQLVWMRFPAPPAGVNVLTLQLDGLDPIEDIPIQN